MAREVEGEIDGLFSLPPEEFTVARDELAKRLKADGRAEEAAGVRGLRRPTVAAWVANQLARERPSDIAELLAAGAELRGAQRKVLRGVKGGFREATDRRRRAVGPLVKAAEAMLEAAGKGSAGTLEAIQATLEAASIDEEAGGELKAGRLTRELSATAGFGDVTGLEVVAAPRERPRDKKKEGDESTRAEEEAAKREARERERAAAEARRRAIKARAEADRLADKANRLARDAEAAKTAAREAGREAKEAEAEAQRAESAAGRAT
jgi:hypothetical protein